MFIVYGRFLCVLGKEKPPMKNKEDHKIDKPRYEMKKLIVQRSKRTK